MYNKALTDKYFNNIERPCPFCGEYGGICIYMDDTNGSRTPLFWVVCDACGISCTKMSDITNAIDAWNKRPEQERLEKDYSGDWIPVGVDENESFSYTHNLTSTSYVELGAYRDENNYHLNLEYNGTGDWHYIIVDLPEHIRLCKKHIDARAVTI